MLSGGVEIITEGIAERVASGVSGREIFDTVPRLRAAALIHRSSLEKRLLSIATVVLEK